MYLEERCGLIFGALNDTYEKEEIRAVIMEGRGRGGEGEGERGREGRGEKRGGERGEERGEERKKGIYLD